VSRGSTVGKAHPSGSVRSEAKALFRNAILDAAEIVFAERGFHEARIQDIAARARIAVGTVYNHFETKEDVLAALLEQHAGAFADALEPASGDPRGFEPALRARVARLLSYIDEHRGFFVLLTEVGGFAHRPKAVERLKRSFRTLVDAGIAAGVLQSAPPERLARFFGMTIKAFVMSQEGSLAAESDAVVDLFLHGAAK
jgi:AcrR family transcriptional regulator